jgi:hypothetical protein
MLFVVLGADELGFNFPADRDRGACVATTGLRDTRFTAGLAWMPSSRAAADLRKLGTVEEKPTAVNIMIAPKPNKPRLSIKSAVLIGSKSPSGRAGAVVRAP